MTARVLRPAISLVAVSAVIVAALAAYLFMTTGQSSADSVFVPQFTNKTCNALIGTFPDPQLAGNPACADVTTLGTPQTTTANLTILDNHLNFSNVTTFAPNATTITPGTTLATSAKVGGLQSLTNLGLLNSECNNAITVDFIFYNVALPDNPGNPRASTNIVYPRAEGQSDRYGRWEAVPGSVNPTDNVTDVAPLDGRADGNTSSITNYPSYLLDTFDPDFIPGGADGPANPILPIAVYGGLTNVVGNWVPLYFAQFAGGALVPIGGAAGGFVAAMGQPNVSVLNDPTIITAAPSSITDFCSSLNTTTVLLGTVPAGGPGAGQVRATNPAVAGTYFSTQYVASLRDLDQDGWENALDSCPQNISADPTDGLNTGDADAEGLMDPCDPSANVGDTDEDNDGFENRQDICPNSAVAGNNSEAEVGTGAPANDDGPVSDSMGNPCDAGVVSATINNRLISFTLSTTVGNGRYHAQTNNDPICFGGIDADGDGYCTTNDTGQDANVFRHNAWSGAYAAPLLQQDTDGDGFSDARETYFRTERTKACQQNPQFPVVTGGLNDETPFDNWPMDFDDNQISNTADVGQYVSRLGLQVNVAVNGFRYDLNHEGIITSVDVGNFVAVLGRRCDAPLPGGMGFPTYNSQTQ
jgi:hypothetical protein